MSRPPGARNGRAQVPPRSHPNPVIRRRMWIACAAALALQACVMGPSAKEAPTSPETGAPTADTGRGAMTLPPDMGDGIGRRTRLAAREPELKTKQAPLIGLKEDALTRLLGRPGFVRRDAPAQVWRYRARACLLDLFLYPGADGLEVTHAEARRIDVARIAVSECLKKIMDARG